MTSLWAGERDRDSYPARGGRKELSKPTYVLHPKCPLSFPCNPQLLSGTDAPYHGECGGQGSAKGIPDALTSRQK